LNIENFVLELLLPLDGLLGAELQLFHVLANRLVYTNMDISFYNKY
jgi:hypothetical protein